MKQLVYRSTPLRPAQPQADDVALGPRFAQRRVGVIDFALNLVR
jgi:hypothetical protein